MSTPDVIIIGGGLAGLSAGIFARASGYSPLILEHHTTVGGVCTAWKREDYLVDGCIHWLTGSRTGALRELYEQVGALEENRLLPIFHFLRFVEESSGRTLDVTADLPALARDLKALSPSDGAAVDELMRSVENIRHLPSGPEEVQHDNHALRKLWGLRHTFLEVFHNRLPVSEYAQRFSDPFVRTCLENLFLPDIPTAGMMYMLAQLGDDQFSVVEGGSLRFATAMERKYLRLGGRVLFNATVEEILTENDRAVGVRLEDGRMIRARNVISAADGYTTIFRMLGGRYVDDEIHERYAQGRLFDPILLITCGLEALPPDGPSAHLLLLRAPLRIHNREVSHLHVRTFSHDPTLAPPGHSVMQVMVPTEFDWWMELHHDAKHYAQEKDRVARQVVEAVARVLPLPTDKVGMLDVATPYTYWRYTRNHRGAFEGWLPSMRMFTGGYEKTLPGLDNFFMAGQWVEPGGGIPTVLMSGREAVHLMCKRDGLALRAPDVTETTELNART
ncbi:MAG: NAD(P)/FAD-dependent oxidoreductase [Myxococcota bacterium]